MKCCLPTDYNVTDVPKHPFTLIFDYILYRFYCRYHSCSFLMKTQMSLAIKFCLIDSSIWNFCFFVLLSSHLILPNKNGHLLNVHYSQRSVVSKSLNHNLTYTIYHNNLLPHNSLRLQYTYTLPSSVVTEVWEVTLTSRLKLTLTLTNTLYTLHMD